MKVSCPAGIVVSCQLRMDNIDLLFEQLFFAAEDDVIHVDVVCLVGHFGKHLEGKTKSGEVCGRS